MIRRATAVAPIANMVRCSAIVAADPEPAWFLGKVMEMVRAEDFQEIHNLMGIYGHVMDEGSRGEASWDNLGQIFTENAVFDMRKVGGPQANGLAEIIAIMSGNPHPSTHHFTNLVITDHDENRLSCVSKIITVNKDGAVNSGEYKDRVVRTTEGWRIEHRCARICFADRSI